MSAWRMGREGRSPYLEGGDRGFKTYIDKLTKWIPGDVLALYVAGITALKGSSPTSEPSAALLVAFAVLTPVVILLGGWRSDPPITNLPARAGLGTGAFLAWSLTLPFSGWQQLNFIAANAAGVAIVAAVVGLLYGLVADKLVGDS